MPYDEVMHKFKQGKLHSGSKKGPVVTNRKQAVAVMLSEKREAEKGKKEYKTKKYQAGGPVGIGTPDSEPTISNPAYNKMPTSTNIEDRRKDPPTPPGTSYDLGIIGKDIEWADPEHTQVKEHVSPEGKAYADKHYSNLPTTPIAQAKGGPVTKHSEKASWRRW